MPSFSARASFSFRPSPSFARPYVAPRPTFSPKTVYVPAPARQAPRVTVYQHDHFYGPVMPPILLVPHPSTYSAVAAAPAAQPQSDPESAFVLSMLALIVVLVIAAAWGSWR